MQSMKAGRSLQLMCITDTVSTPLSNWKADNWQGKDRIPEVKGIYDRTQ